MAVEVIDKIKPKNGGSFPVVEAVDVEVSEGLRLPEALNQKAEQSDLEELSSTLTEKADASDLANLQGQINQIEISATAEAVVAPEVAAARVGTEGKEYSTLKERIDTENIIFENNMMWSFRNDISIPIYTFTDSGYIRKTDGKIVNGDYETTSFIKVSEGDLFTISSLAGSGSFVVGMYQTNSGTADTSLSILGTSSISTFTFAIPSGINYIRCCCTNANIDNFFLYKRKNVDNSITGDHLIYTYKVTKGYVKSNDGSIVSNENYRYSDMIRVIPGQKFSFSSSASSNTFAIAMYENLTDVSADLQKSITGNENPDARDVIIPSGINYIRFVYSTSTPSPFIKENLSKFSTGLETYEEEINEITINESLLNSKIDTVYDRCKRYTLKKRKASVSFIFDDGHYKDEQIKEIFDAHNKRCGFAVYAPVPSRYEKYHNEGYEILAHASDPIENPTETLEREQMKTAYEDVISAVGECFGWVTPSSELSPEFQPIVYDYFEYGYTVYKGNVSNPSEVCMDKTLASYKLWRQSLQSLTLAEQKAIIDYAVENNLLICFYGHASHLDTNDNLTTENLNAIINYCDTVGISVDIPYVSTINYMEFRHNEDYVDENV